MQHQGISLSSGNPLSAAMSAAGSLAGANHSDSAASTTYAAVSDGNIIIRDKAHQKQSVSELSRDTDHAANGLSPIFNKQNELKRLQTVQLLSDIGSQVSDIALTEGKIRAAQQAKTQTENASATERRRVRNKLTAEANARAEKTGKPAAAVSEAAVTQKIYTTHYNQALTESGFGTGGKYQRAITAATAAIQGLITNNPGAALSGAAAPYLATEIKRLTTDKNDHQNKPAALLAHAIVNAALAVASGEGKQGAIAAAAGAVTGEATAIIASQAFHKPVSELSEEEKQTVSTLATLASGLAGGLLTDSGTGALTAAQAGKTTAENNFFVPPVVVSAGTGTTGIILAGTISQEQAKETGLALNKFVKGAYEQISARLTPEERSEKIKSIYSSLTPAQQNEIDRILERNRLQFPKKIDLNAYLTKTPFGEMLNENSSQFDYYNNRVIQTTTVSPGNSILTGDYVKITNDGLIIYNKYGSFKVALNHDGSKNWTLSDINKNSTIDPHNLYPVSEITAQSGNGYHNKNSQPNIGKKLSAQDIANLGGTGSGMPGGFEPEDKDTKELTTSDRRSIRSLEKRIQEHKEKLEEYKRNPDLFDNKEYLENASGEDVRKEIINGRIRHLEKEIQTFEKNINDIKNRSK